MKILIRLLFILVFFSNTTIAQTNEAEINTPTQELVEYSNSKFKFNVSIPIEWHLYNEKRDGRKKLTVEWLLPKIYDSVQKKHINSTIYIRAFRSKSTKDVDDMILSAYLGIAGKSISLVLEQNIDTDSRILYMDLPNGDKYKGKVYFKFNNGIGYRITYQTTHDTYESNLEVFENFISSFEYN